MTLLVPKTRIAGQQCVKRTFRQERVSLTRLCPCTWKLGQPCKNGLTCKPWKNGLTGKNVNEQPNLARVRETGRTSAKHSHSGKNTVFWRCFMVARANLGKTDLRAKTWMSNPTLPVYVNLGGLVRNTVIWAKTLRSGGVSWTYGQKREWATQPCPCTWNWAD
jgi:hypothetical protein